MRDLSAKVKKNGGRSQAGNGFSSSDLFILFRLRGSFGRETLGGGRDCGRPIISQQESHLFLCLVRKKVELCHGPVPFAR